MTEDIAKSEQTSLIMKLKLKTIYKINCVWEINIVTCVNSTI